MGAEQDQVTRFYFDCEFVEDGKSIDLVSIGIAADDDREYYAVSADFDRRALLANPWLRDNVWPSLPHAPSWFGCNCTHGYPRGAGHVHLDVENPDVRPLPRIATEVREFLLAGPGRPGRPELWAWYGAYDHVALCWLFGNMTALPDGLPMWTHELEQEIERAGRGDPPPQTDGVHNALADARHARDIGRWLGHV